MTDQDVSPWAHGSAWCLECHHEWVAVWPLGADSLECPVCGGTDTDRDQQGPHERKKQMSNWFPIPRSAESATVIPRSRLVTLEKEEQIASHAKRLALELECILLATHDTEAATTWWQSAYQAMHNYQDDVDRLYPQDHVSPLGKG